VVEGPDGSKTVTKFSSGWGSPAKEGEAPDFVRVSAGTKAYAQGDTVEITLKSPYAGQAQVAVATDRLIDFKTLSVGENGTTVRLKTSAAWGGGAYVMVTVIQPRDPVSSPKPKRALGLIYVPLDPKGRKLTVDIGTPVKLDSKAPVEVPIKVQGLGFGQKAKVTIAAVDEGILRLTRQDSPDPAKWYFGKRALTLNYRDDYGRLLDPNMGAPANVNFGADELGGEGLTVTPIKTVALWSGIVETGLDGKAVVKLPAADFNGELRIMAVAWTDTAVGSGSKPLTVRQPVVADLNLPRFLAPGDKPMATLELHNVEGKAGAYTVEANATNGIAVAFRKVITLVLGQRIAEKIPFLAPTVTGIGKVGFKVSRTRLPDRQGLSDPDPPGLGRRGAHHHRAAAAGHELSRPTPSCCRAWRPATSRCRSATRRSRASTPRRSRWPCSAIPTAAPSSWSRPPIRCSTPRASPAIPSSSAIRRSWPGRWASCWTARPWTGPSACGGWATARPTPGWAPTPPTSWSRPRPRAWPCRTRRWTRR
jgi:uncharacterized protein YfaS (alpha-2-macroglobulin family)